MNRSLGIVGLILMLTGCGETPLPDVQGGLEVPFLRVGEIDRQVISAVLDQRIRKVIESEQQGRPYRITLVDTTLTACGPPAPHTPYSRWDCLAPDNPQRGYSLLNRLAIAAMFPNLRMLFEERNDWPLRIEGYFGDDVVLVPNRDAADGVGLLHEPGVTVSVSAPFYPATNTAVVFYNRLHSDDGFIHLERNREEIGRAH